MSKVYCAECRYYVFPSYGEFSYSPDECWYPENIKIESTTVKGTYRYAEYVVKNKKLILQPEKINKHNDCEWFKKRKQRWRRR